MPCVHTNYLKYGLRDLTGEKRLHRRNFLLFGFFLFIFLKTQNPIQHHKFPPKYFKKDLRLKMSIL